MSTTYGVKVPHLDEPEEIAFFTGGWMFWKNNIACLLPDETPVIALDNDDDIHTVGEIKKYISDQEEKQKARQEHESLPAAEIIEEKPDDTKWISVKDKMPVFQKGNVLSNHVWAKGRDGVIKKDVSLFQSIGMVSCFGATPAHQHADIIEWQPM